MPIERTLDGRSLSASRTRDVVAGAIVLALVLAAAYLPPWASSIPAWIPPCVAACIGLAGIVEVAVLEPRSFRAFSYHVGQSAIEIRRGVALRTTQCIPFRQILVVERKVGVILRRYGVVAVTFKLPEGTASIYGITEEAYEEIRQAVLQSRVDA